ncbi:hypothetical protein ACFFX0_30560 [Citricoccus parietis]|uniref:Uncharacterized protein n=1 Tax=Citricoccus parietis TaxID=592307 RepID=A0ABV5G8Q3_9MICC
MDTASPRDSRSSPSTSRSSSRVRCVSARVAFPPSAPMIAF